jgi:MSHA biogenesis protein MshN
MSLINQVLQDLEKRHAADSELQTLPPFVRPVASRAHWSRMFMFAGMFALALCAFAAFMYGRLWAPVDVPKLVPQAARVKVPEPTLVQPEPPAATTPVAAAAAPSLAYVPVSRLSDELSLVAPSSRPPQKPSATEKRAKPLAARAPEVVEPPPVEQAQASVEQKESSSQRPPQAEAPAKAAAPVSTPALRAQTEAPEGAPSGINKQMREVAPAERAEIVFRKGVAQIQEGRANAAELEFRDALKQDPTHVGALQALLGLLVDSGRNNEAEQFLVKALQINPRQPRHAMVLARLEVERGDVTGAINTMVAALPYVQTDFDFYAFLAALLQREGRHREAVDYYRTALRGVSGNGVWMMGLAISLRASNQAAEAREAFASALNSKQLSPALQEFVERQLRELAGQKKN